MNTRFHRSLSAHLTLAALVAVMLIVPVISLAQTNTSTGAAALPNDSGYDNTADGYFDLNSNISGVSNTAVGSHSIQNNLEGNFNTAIGSYSLTANLLGTGNSAIGSFALYSNTTGNQNTADGPNALYHNTTGGSNVALGYYALFNNTIGSFNTALGYGAGVNLTTGSYNIDIGNAGVAAESGVIRIGTHGSQTKTFIVGIDKVTVSNGVEVFIDANGQLGTIKSSRRFKHDIKDMGTISDKLIKLRPVTFRYKDSAEEGPHALQYGLIAEEVAKVYPDLVQYDKQGKPFTVYYHLLTPMLLNEFQKEHRQNIAHQRVIAALTTAHNVDKSEITSLKAALQTQCSELAALKQSQQQLLASVTKLTVLVQTSQIKAPLQSALYTRH